MAYTIGAAVLGATVSAVQSNQQKVADQKQRDALSDAEKNQQKILDSQKAADLDRKKKEELATRQAFALSAAKRQGVSGAALPGAVPQSAIGAPGNPSLAPKKLIGS